MMRTILFYRGIAYICKNQETHSAGRQDYWRQYLQGTHFFDKLYVKMNEAEKREFLSQLVDNVPIYEVLNRKLYPSDDCKLYYPI